MEDLVGCEGGGIDPGLKLYVYNLDAGDLV